MFGLLRKKEFNFGQYLVELGYTESVVTINHTNYSNGNYYVDVFNRSSGNYSLVSISSNYEDFNLATFKFIPNSKVMVDMILSNIQSVVEQNNETIQ